MLFEAHAVAAVGDLGLARRYTFFGREFIRQQYSGDADTEQKQLGVFHDHHLKLVSKADE